MSAEAEVGNLIVRLTGDGSGFHKMLNDAGHGAEQTAKSVEHATNRIEKFTHDVQHFAEHAAHALEAMEVGHWIKEAFHEFGEAEHQSHRLDAALEVQGRNVEAMVESYNSFGQALQDITVVSKMTTTAMLAQAETMGLTDEAAKRAVKNAVALSAAKTGTAENASTFLRASMMLEQGNNALVKRMLGLRGVKNETEAAAKIQKSLAAGFEIAKGEAHGALGQFSQLNNIYKEFMISVGKIVAEGIHPLVEGLQQMARWINSLSSETKTFIAVFAGLATVFLGFGPFVATLKTLLTIFNPITMLITAAAIAATYFINKLGGVGPVWKMIEHGAEEAWDFILEKFHEVSEFVQPWFDRIVGWINIGWGMIVGKSSEAWDFVQSTVSGFLEWFQPATDAAVSFFETAWEAAVSLVTGLWSDLKESSAALWDLIQAGWAITLSLIDEGVQATGINFNEVFTAIRDLIRDAFIAGEFAITHFSEIAQLAWTSVMLGAVTFANQLEYFFTTQLPAYFNWFIDNWGNMWETAWDFTKTVFSNLAENAGNFFSKLWDSMTGGEVDWSEGWKGLADGFKNTLQELPTIADRQMSELEKTLTEDVSRLSDKVSDDFDKFRSDKLGSGDFGASGDFGFDELPKEIPKDIEKATDHAENEADKLGQKTKAKFNQGAKKEKDHFEAADFFSAEALSRINAFQSEGGLTASGGGGGKGGAVEFGSAAAGGLENDVLDEISSGIGELVQIGTKQLDKDPFEFAEAGIA